MVSGHKNEPKYETKATLKCVYVPELALEPDIEHLLTPPPPFCVCVCVFVYGSTCIDAAAGPPVWSGSL